MANINNLSTLVRHLNRIIVNNNSSLCRTIPYISAYNGDDWKNRIVAINEKSYVKHLIYGNNFYELFLISWNNASSKWHGHPDNGCVMKILSGSLHEYTHDNGIIRYRLLKEKDIGFKMSNDMHNIISCGVNHSLHIYSPICYRERKSITSTHT